MLLGQGGRGPRRKRANLHPGKQFVTPAPAPSPTFWFLRNQSDGFSRSTCTVLGPRRDLEFFFQKVSRRISGKRPQWPVMGPKRAAGSLAAGRIRLSRPLEATWLFFDNELQRELRVRFELSAGFSRARFAAEAQMADRPARRPAAPAWPWP